MFIGIWVELKCERIWVCDYFGWIYEVVIVYDEVGFDVFLFVFLLWWGFLRWC